MERRGRIGDLLPGTAIWLECENVWASTGLEVEGRHGQRSEKWRMRKAQFLYFLFSLTRISTVYGVWSSVESPPRSHDREQGSWPVVQITGPDSGAKSTCPEKKKRDSQEYVLPVYGVCKQPFNWRIGIERIAVPHILPGAYPGRGPPSFSVWVTSAPCLSRPIAMAREARRNVEKLKDRNETNYCCTLGR